MADGPFPALVEAVQQFRGDKYSQGRRWQHGYSDCSSFVGKGMKALGQNPGASTTLTYLASSHWNTISKSQAGAGDIAVNAVHMVLVTGANTAIGQENPRRNVQTGTISGLMTGTGPYVIKRYEGGSNITFAGYTGDATQAGFSIPESMINTLNWLSNSTNWLRIGMIFAGVLLLWITVIGIGKSEMGGLLGSTVQKQGKKVINRVKSKS